MMSGIAASCARANHRNFLACLAFTRSLTLLADRYPATVVLGSAPQPSFLAMPAAGDRALTMRLAVLDMPYATLWRAHVEKSLNFHSHLKLCRSVATIVWPLFPRTDSGKSAPRRYHLCLYALSRDRRGAQRFRRCLRLDVRLDLREQLGRQLH